MPKAYLTRRYRFSSSHRLHCDGLSPEANQKVYGKCNNPHGHGHNYFLEVTLGGQVDPVTGMVCDLGILDGFVNQNIVERYEHANLNTLEEFSNSVPTSENLCTEIYDILQRGFTAAEVDKVRLEETSNNFFEYSGNKPLRD